MAIEYRQRAILAALNKLEQRLSWRDRDLFNDALEHAWMAGHDAARTIVYAALDVEAS